MNKITEKIIAVLLGIWLAGSLFGGIMILREEFKKGIEWPNGEKFGYGSVGVVEVLSPIWVPFNGLGRLITFGIEK